jgi:hypothetical protein
LRRHLRPDGCLALQPEVPASSVALRQRERARQQGSGASTGSSSGGTDTDRRTRRGLPPGWLLWALKSTLLLIEEGDT